jgi:hypothetical protein
MPLGLVVMQLLRKHNRHASMTLENQEFGERGRNRTYNLLIKSYGSRFGYSVINCSYHNNLTIKRPAWRASENVEKVGEIEPRLIAKAQKRHSATLTDSPDPRLILFRNQLRNPDTDGSQQAVGSSEPNCWTIT